MRIYPAIHIKNGRCFNPSPKHIGNSNIFTSNPVKLAKIWEEAGASYIHVVDVDGATLGYPVHAGIIKEILSEVHIPIQAGGGLRTIKDVDDFLNLGVARVVCGTKAVLSTNFVTEVIRLFGPARMVIGIDAKNGMVAIEGREKISNFNAITLANNLKECGVETIIYTDIIRASTHKGPSIENTKELIAKSGLNIILSGGIYNSKHLEDISRSDVQGVLIASALYEGKIDLSEALNAYERGR